MREAGDNRRGDRWLAATGAHDMLPGQWIVEVTAVKDGRIIVHEGTRIAVIRGRK